MLWCITPMLNVSLIQEGVQESYQESTSNVFDSVGFSVLYTYHGILPRNRENLGARRLILIVLVDKVGLAVSS